MRGSQLRKNRFGDSVEVPSGDTREQKGAGAGPFYNQGPKSVYREQRSCEHRSDRAKTGAAENTALYKVFSMVELKGQLREVIYGADFSEGLF